VFGEVAGGLSARIRALEAVICGAGFDGRVSESVMHDMWEKFVQLGLGAGITCLMRASIGDILAAPGGREAMFSLFDECCAIATASGYPPRPAFIEFDQKLITTVGSPLKWSMLRDIERGSTTEGEHILGDMVARARKFGVATPILDLARTHVAAYEIARAKAVREAAG
jgi:2-dehydropantoate 2-reductase